MSVAGNRECGWTTVWVAGWSVEGQGRQGMEVGTLCFGDKEHGPWDQMTWLKS